MFAKLPCSQVHAALAPFGATNQINEMLETITGRRKMYACTDDSLLSVHVSRAKLQKTEL